jgi:hypothetical protein
MISEIIQKVVLPKKDIESVSSDGKYLVRYRVVTSDRRKVSHWSPIFVLDGGSLYSASSVVTKTVDAGVRVNVSWNILNTLGINNYDVYVKYGASNFVYYGTTSNTSIVIPIVTTPSTMNVAILAQGTTTLSYAEISANPTLSGLPTYLGATGSFSV